MELKIEDLVSSIKKDGIDAANAEADRIINEAKNKAKQIIDDAKKQQEIIKQQTANELEVLRDSAKVGAAQAQRDAVLLFEDSVKKEFKKILDADIAKTVKGDNLVTLIKAAIGEENPNDYFVEISQVEEGIKAQLAEEIKNGLEIRISPSVKTGFRLNSKDGSGYFDCSNEEIAEMLAPFLPEINF